MDLPVKVWAMALALVLLAASCLPSQCAQGGPRSISGAVLTDKNEAVAAATVTAQGEAFAAETRTDNQGRFRFQAPPGPIRVTVTGKYLVPAERLVSAEDEASNLEIHTRYSIASVHDSILITATALNPTIDQRNDAVYKNTLFARDDQIFDTLASGINTGQHEGGGKSLEIRRFGYNLDHGGVNGGLKVLVDDIQQNQATQGHGQGYLGVLKSLTPELVDDVEIINGPFSAEYGDFSGLGVVHIRLKEILPDQLTVRVQGGSFDAYRAFVGFSPTLQNADAFIAYEGSHSDGPFITPGRYGRNNITVNDTLHLGEHQSLGLKTNFGTNDFYSCGQIPLDLVSDGVLPRFGFMDPFGGGRVRLGTVGAYYKRDFSNGGILKVDGFLGRSLFDLWSNFTFFLVHDNPTATVFGDEIQQHDSRLQQGVNAQYLHPYKLFGRSALLTLGSNFHDNQIDVGLFQTQQRMVRAISTNAHAHVTNGAGYVQQGIDLLHQRLHFDAGLRYDYFRFDVDDHLVPPH